LGAEEVWAVDVTPERSVEKPPEGVLGLALRAVDLMQHHLTASRMALYAPEVYLRPELGEVAVQDFLRLEEAVEALGRDAVILASTDFNHYDPHDVTFRKDMRAIEAMESLDVEEFYRVVMREDVSVCGPLGVMVLMLLARRRRGGRPEILAHATSGDTSGDLSHTVGYVAAKFPLRASGAI
ncbi:MAG: AmmeMemoRadiSam system protein B, partial [Fervidicoccaceae archaeon]